MSACPQASPLSNAGLHPATGGDGRLACFADMLSEALVACAGMTMAAIRNLFAPPGVTFAFSFAKIARRGEVQYSHWH